jgi:hypothetical protein
MKKLIFLTAILLTVGMSSAAMAEILTLPLGATYIKFDNREQISAVGNAITAPSGAKEQNWGVFIASSISKGDLSTDPQNFDPGTDPSDSIWSALFGGIPVAGEITGIFWGIQAAAPPPGVALASQGGKIRFYFDETPDASLAAAMPSDRTADDTFTNFTDGTLLAELDFKPGGVAPAPITIVGSATPSGGGFAGVADSFADVVDTDSDGDIDADDGAWAPYLAGKYFPTLFGAGNADLKFRNGYSSPGQPTGHPWDAMGSITVGTDTIPVPIFGAQSTDPARAYVVPEPTTLLLVGLGLFGLAGIGRKKYLKK